MPEEKELVQEPIEEIPTENLPENNGEYEEQQIENLPEPLPEVEQEVTDLDTITAFVPKKLNVNRNGEWIFKIGTLCYGISCRKNDNKMMITYNIDPAWLHPDFFLPYDMSLIPARVFELFQQKLSTDIMRLDSMMNNLVLNKTAIGKLFKFAEQNKNNGVAGMEEAQAYSDEDAHKDKQAEMLQARNMRTNLQQGKPKRKKRRR